MGAKKRIDEELAKELRLQGMKYEDIAKQIGCSVGWCKVNLKGVYKNPFQTRKLVRVRARRKTRDFQKPEGYYVYCAVLGEDVVYVGMGTGHRYEHINSGISACYALNKMHFDGIKFNVFILYSGLSSEQALLLEKEETMRIDPKYNIVNKRRVYMNE